VDGEARRDAERRQTQVVLIEYNEYNTRQDMNINGKYGMYMKTKVQDKK